MARPLSEEARAKMLAAAHEIIVSDDGSTDETRSRVEALAREDDRIRLVGGGANRGKVDLKKAGIFAITEGASLLALENNVDSGTTWDKLEKLGQLSVLSKKDSERISEAFSQLVNFRLQHQLRELAAGNKPGNAVDPQRMPEKTRGQLREALRGVNLLLRIIREHYRLDFISR